jgi:hypothetical protein
MARQHREQESGSRPCAPPDDDRRLCKRLHRSRHRGRSGTCRPRPRHSGHRGRAARPARPESRQSTERRTSHQAPRREATRRRTEKADVRLVADLHHRTGTHRLPPVDRGSDCGGSYKSRRPFSTPSPRQPGHCRARIARLKTALGCPCAVRAPRRGRTAITTVSIWRPGGQGHRVGRRQRFCPCRFGSGARHGR